MENVNESDGKKPRKGTYIRALGPRSGGGDKKVQVSRTGTVINMKKGSPTKTNNDNIEKNHDDDSSSTSE